MLQVYLGSTLWSSVLYVGKIFVSRLLENTTELQDLDFVLRVQSLWLLKKLYLTLKGGVRHQFVNRE